jgi:hypothetical protein
MLDTVIKVHHHAQVASQISGVRNKVGLLSAPDIESRGLALIVPKQTL